MPRLGKRDPREFLGSTTSVYADGYADVSEFLEIPRADATHLSPHILRQAERQVNKLAMPSVAYGREERQQLWQCPIHPHCNGPTIVSRT